MYAALFEVKGWAGLEQYIFEAENAVDLMYKFNRVQDLECLVRMGRMQEPQKGQVEIDKLEALVEKHYDHDLEVEDLLTLDVNLSIGFVRCVCIVEGEEAISALKAQHPKAR